MTERWRRLLVATVLVEAVLSTGVAVAARWLWTGAAASDRRCRAVAAYVDLHAAPEARILVWGNSPEIYFYSHRLPATRFLSSNYQTGHVWGTASNRDGAEGDPAARSTLAWARLLEDLRRAPPAFVVDAAAGGLGHMEREAVTRQPELRAWLGSTCRWQAEVGAIPIYVCRAPVPAAPPPGPGDALRR